MGNINSFSKIFSFAIIGIMLMMCAPPIEAQGTNIGTFKHVGSAKNHIVWTVALADFDSAAVVWSTGFVLDSKSAATVFDAQGSIDLGTAASGGTYSTVVELWGSFDDGTSWILCDALGTITAATVAKIELDVGTYDQAPQYKLKVTNGGADNSFKLGIFRE